MYLNLFIPSSKSGSARRGRFKRNISGFITYIKLVKSSKYNRDFKQKLADKGIFINNIIEPVNLTEIKAIINRLKRSLSPTNFLNADF